MVSSLLEKLEKLDKRPFPENGWKNWTLYVKSGA